MPALKATEYLLRVNHGSGPPGSKTPVHTHPGSEAFYVLVMAAIHEQKPMATTFDENGLLVMVPKL